MGRSENNHLITMLKVCFITIGESPRDDVMKDLKPILPPIEISERGALDNLKIEEFEKLRPSPEDMPLITRLKNGKIVKVGKSKIIPLLQEKIENAEKSSNLMVLLCTDDFDLKSSIPLLLPFKMIKEKLENLNFKGRFLLFIPLEEQIPWVVKKWKTLRAVEMDIKVLNPYIMEPEVSLNLRELGKNYGLGVLDCIGYPLWLKEKLEEAMNIPILSPRSSICEGIKNFLKMK